MHLTIPPSLREATIAATVDAIQRLKDRRAAEVGEPVVPLAGDLVEVLRRRAL